MVHSFSKCHMEFRVILNVDNLLNQKYSENSKHSTFINGQIFDIQRSTFCCDTFHKPTLIIELAFQPKRSPPTHCSARLLWRKPSVQYIQIQQEMHGLVLLTEAQMRSRWFTSESVDAQWVNMRGRSDKETWTDKLEIWYRLLMIGSPPVCKLCRDKIAT